jgi:dienelactone hydrolase
VRILVALIASFISLSAAAETVKIKWNAGNYSNPWDTGASGYIDGWTKNFMNGTVEERGKTTLNGFLNAEIASPKRANGPVPFVIVLHGCSGVNAVTNTWAQRLISELVPRGYGVLVLDSFKSRGVANICSDPSQLGWARRRTDDAYSALDYLIETGRALPKKVYVVGGSNGATTTLIIMNQVLGDLHSHTFAGGFALQPSCLYMKNVEFYAPVRQFLAEKDKACNPALCTAMAAASRRISVKTELFKGAYHAFEYKQSARIFHGYQIAYDADATNNTVKGILSALKEGEKN